MRYNPATIEPRWQQWWEERKLFHVSEDSSKPKYYVLDMFPYPSGAGLHVGHPEGYTATDIMARYKKMQGFNVLHPMGWDAFGLPAENHAVKTGTHPAITTAKNVENFTRQIKRLGFAYDWDREVNTTDPKYYRWTQWIFRKLYEKGLAYEAEVPVNWCPALGTVLANEEVIDGKSEVGDHPVIRRPMRQWMLKITAYAERLLENLDDLDWPEETKLQQRNWIGKSEGARAFFTVDGDANTQIEIFTTRPDTLFGATYMVLAPEHPLVDRMTTDAQRSEVEAYREAAATRSDLARTDLNKDKTGVFTGGYAINPVNDEKIPVWVADYVLMSYGTGAIMAVPAHDERDWEFATKYSLPITEVVSGGNVQEAPYTGDGELVNSGLITGLPVPEAKAKITAWLEEKGLGQGAVNYKLRDWVFARQRYWGEPFPIVHTKDGEPRLLPESALPVTLPEVESYEPTGTGDSPLAAMTDWVETTDPETGEPVLRETNTMPQWAGSCWYYLRYIDAQNDNAPWDADKENYWMPVDLYVGGREHAVLHLLYSRFWHKVLYDLGLVSTPEPFKKLVHQGLILGEDGEKMSKSRGNVVNPDDIIDQYGADAFRLYEMYMGPLERVKPWKTSGMDGMRRYLERLWRLFHDEEAEEAHTLVDSPLAAEEALQVLHQTIQKVTQDIENMRFNTGIAQLITCVNAFTKLTVRNEDALATLVQLTAPFAPHIAEELWRHLGHEDSIFEQPWPKADDALARVKVLKIAVQINGGRPRGVLEVGEDTDNESVKQMALELDSVQRELAGGEPTKVIYVPGRIVNVVIKK